MSLSAYIKFVKGSTVEKVTLEDLKEKLNHYIDMTSKTGQQLNWDYAGAAFPYEIVETDEGKGTWFYLKGKDPNLYKYIVMGVGSETIEKEVEKPAGDGEEKEKVTVKEPHEQHYIQVVLPDGATHGDKGKANEFCKYLAREYKAELHLFNGRVMYFNPR
ncbi:MAG: DUF1885 family protein [Bacillaceae bacterium]|nr:DUF1885 family protein [Bacillaceae bacterium]